MAVGVPAAIVGAIALALSTSPAHADDRRSGASFGGDLTLRAVPATAIPTVTNTAVANTSGVRAAATTPATYTVKRGDTISTIAGRHGLRTADVLALNGLGWKSVIYPGQVLTLTNASPATPAASTSTSPAISTGAYTIKAGDTISAIASRHGVSTASLLSANGLRSSSIIYPGQKITVPGAATTTAAPAAPAQAAPAAPVSAAPAAGSSYTIAAGDTMSAIASRHGVSTSAVLSANGLGAASIIYPGQTITIPGAGVAASVPASNSAPVASIGLDAEQSENARLIIQVGREMGVPERGIAIALGTAMQESWIRNLDWGDRDSLGLFQQRPSTGWGTEDQVRDRVRSIKTFYGGPGDPNGYATRGLLDIPGWQSMSYADAAQAVQISAYPDRYAQWEKPSYAWLAALG